MKSRLLISLLLACASFVAIAQDAPKADLFAGYSFLRFNSAQNIPAFSANGGLTTFGYNFNNHIGLEAEVGFYYNGNISGYQLDTTSVTYLFGPRFSLGRSKRFDPYFHVLFGGMRASTSIAIPISQIPPGVAPGTGGGRYSYSQNNFSMAAGGGIDIRVNKIITFRPIQLDYVLTRFQLPTLPDLTSPSTNRNQNSLRYAAGVMFNFGGERPTPPPPAPAMKACPGGGSVNVNLDCPKKDIGLGLTAAQSEVCAGTTVNVTPAASLPPGANPQWTVNGEAISQGPALDFGTNGRNPGPYKIGLKVSADGFNEASAETTITVRAYSPPSGTLAVAPTEVMVGDKATLTANFNPGQCGGSLQPAVFSAAEGTINGNQFDSSTVQFDPNDNSAQQKSVTLTAKVSDGTGSGDAQSTILVKKNANITAKRLPDVIFQKNSARVNNCGKRVLLEDLKTYTDSDSTANVVFVGHQADTEEAPGLDLKRALNAAAVISANQGICTAFPASQILVSAVGTDQAGVDFQPHFCGTSGETPERPGQGVQDTDDAAKNRRVEVWFVPTNGKLPRSLVKEYKDAATLSVVGIGCPK